MDKILLVEDEGAQINRLLIERRKIKANFKKEQISSKSLAENYIVGRSNTTS